MGAYSLIAGSVLFFLRFRFFGELFFLVAFGAVVDRFGERAVITAVHDHAPHFFGFFPASVAPHNASLTDVLL